LCQLQPIQLPGKRENEAIENSDGFYPEPVILLAVIIKNSVTFYTTIPHPLKKRLIPALFIKN